MKTKPLPDHAELHRLFDYDPAGGALFWRFRPEMKANWNARYAGRPAGALTREGRLHLTLGGESLMVHRLIWKWVTGEEPEEAIDHRNGQPADNRWANLREASHSENMRNRASWGAWPKGVIKDPTCERFIANIGDERIGRFDTPDEAHAAYAAEAAKRYGAFACFDR